MDFRTINKYVLNNFDSLTADDFPVEKQNEYCLKWLNDYSKISKSTDDKILIDWTIREWRAIKELYASAIFFKEAEFSYKNRCMAACYFLLYYSLFHGMLSSLCYDVNLTLKEITEITHSKLGNIFKSTFCNGKTAIVHPQIYEDFLKFRYLREYYSYTPPLNMPMYDEEYLEIV